MNIQAVRNLMTISVLAIGLAACAGTNTNPAKQYDVWYAKEAKTERDYKLDQAQCYGAHDMQAGRPVALDSLSFEGYRDCMTTKGYVLRQY
ncbi:MAG: hypothetical protein OXF68_07480 [Gammaproteobacteria bacterium]|nr:hypothetical protein [Gammaproteobacteria bacterium]